MWFGHASRNLHFSFGLGSITPHQHFSHSGGSLPPLSISGVFEKITWNFWCPQVSVWGVKPCLRSKSMSHSHGVRTGSIHFSKRHKEKDQCPLGFRTHRAVTSGHVHSRLNYSWLKEETEQRQGNSQGNISKKSPCKVHSVTLWCWATWNPAPAGLGVSDSAPNGLGV